MTLKDDVQPLLDQYVRFNGRGNVISANLTLVSIIEKLIAAVDLKQIDNLPPEGLEDPSMIVSLQQLVQQVQQSNGTLPVAIRTVEDKPRRGRPRKQRD